MDQGAREPDSQTDHQRTDIIDPSHAENDAGVPGQTLQLYEEQEQDTFARGTNFGRYENLEFLGQGAMAKVYKADDPSLGRIVALKFIRGDDPRLVKRLMMEAHSHAKVEHKHVCKIYEVSEAEGKPYIAMQYINGRTLRELMPQLNIQEKVKLIKEVAEAIHATHRVGVIHRDLKPSNILVERNEDGEWVPYVMDFGIARVAEAEGLTMTGMVIGTPWYMSPEQALGKAREVDRRSDVYSLGATLYELLSEKLPFDNSESTADALARVVRDEPVPLRKRDSSIPVDLETIVMKCLEKEPIRRYDSARELAEELQRFLNGETIEARPTSFVYRLYKKSQKHKTIAVILLVSVFAIILMSAIAINTWRTSKQQAFLAQQFGQQLTQIEQTIGMGHLLPLHNTEGEKQKVRAQMQSIEQQMKEFGKAGFGPGHYALGRANLSLEDYEKARDHLQLAWDGGYKEPSVAYSLGLTLGELYRKQLDDVERIRSPKKKETERKKIEAAYRDPALNLLKQGAATQTEVPEYAEALIAFYEQDWSKALQKSNEARSKNSELYEVDLLQGNIFLDRGTKERLNGNHDEAERYFKQARERFSEATNVARSDARGYDGLCRTGYQVIYTKFYSGNGEIRPEVQSSLTDCSNALKADPERSDIMGSQLAIYSIFAEFQVGKGEDPTNTFDQAIKIGEAALKVDPKNGRVYINLGNVYINRGDYERNYGKNPVESYQQSARNYKAAIENLREPDQGYAQLANALGAIGGYEEYQGQDPSAKLLQAIENYEKALKINPTAAYYNNLSLTFYDLGAFESKRGKDPSSWLKKSEDALRQAIRIDPNMLFPYNNLGHTLLAQAEYGIRNGKNPQEIITMAQQNFDRAHKMNPNYFQAYWNAAVGYRILDDFALLNGAQPAHLNQIESILKKAEELRPEMAVVPYERGIAHLQAARFEFTKNKSPERELEIARKDLDKAIALDTTDSEIYIALANYWKLQAKWKYLNKQNFSHELSEGLAATDKALANDASSSLPYAIRGVLQSLKASAEVDTLQKKQSYEIARKEFEKALSIDPYLLPEDKVYWDELKNNESRLTNRELGN